MDILEKLCYFATQAAAGKKYGEGKSRTRSLSRGDRQGLTQSILGSVNAANRQAGQGRGFQRIKQEANKPTIQTSAISVLHNCSKHERGIEHLFISISWGLGDNQSC